MRTGILSSACAALTLLAPVGLADETQPTIHVGTQIAQVMATKITVADLRRSYDFYTEVIGLKPVEIPGLPAAILDDPAVTYTDAKLNFSGSRADPFLILRKQKGEVPSRDHATLTWLVIKTADVRAVVNRVKNMGLPVRQDPREFMGAVVGIVSDPDGYVVELLQAPAVETSTSE